MFWIRDDFTRFNAVYFMYGKDEFTKYFSPYLAEYRFTGVPSPTDAVYADNAAKFKD